VPPASVAAMKIPLMIITLLGALQFATATQTTENKCAVGSDCPNYHRLPNFDGSGWDTGASALYGFDIPTTYQKWGILYDICSADPACNGFQYGSPPVPSFISLPASDVYDFYVKTNGSGTRCQISNSTCSNPGQFFLDCGTGGDWNNGVLATFVLPPQQIYDACETNPDCVAFRLQKDGTKGTLYKFYNKDWVQYKL